MVFWDLGLGCGCGVGDLKGKGMVSAVLECGVNIVSGVRNTLFR